MGPLVLRVHYSADPVKRNADWVATHKPNAPSEEWWNQEQEIDFGARQGARVYPNFKDDDTCLVDDFAIPESWTRYFVLDPHPGSRTPHAFLWGAMAPDDTLYIYRELWPSKSYGLAKNVPEDDDVWSIWHYCETVKWLESGKDDDVVFHVQGSKDKRTVKGNPKNKQKEKIHQRIIDYAARGFGKDADDPDALNYQERYEQFSAEMGHPFHFEDCVKDNEAAYAEVNEWLRARPSLTPDGDVQMRSRVRIFKSCVELRFELMTNRHQMLQAHQVDTRDPQMKAIQKRNHCTDGLKYLIQAKPRFVKKKAPPPKVANIYEGIYA